MDVIFLTLLGAAVAVGIVKLLLYVLRHEGQNVKDPERIKNAAERLTVTEAFEAIVAPLRKKPKE